MPGADVLVTVAIPTHNRTSGLRTALGSVVGQLHSNLEIIISDNNTAEDIKPVVEKFGDSRIRYYKHNQTLPMTANWNFCLDKAAGEYFLLLSDDDLLFPDAVSRLLEAICAKPAAFAYGRAVFKDAHGHMMRASFAAPETEKGSSFIRASLSGKRQALPSFTLFRTEAARSLGGYPETGNSTDLALRLSLAASGDVRFVRAPVGVYVIHPDSMTGDIDKTMESFQLLSAWSAQPDCPVLSWTALLKEYCADSLRKKARSLALRGDIASGTKLVACAASLTDLLWYDNFLLRFFSNPVIRALAAVRRAISKLYVFDK